MRTVKPPDIRRREIIEAAAALFVEKGCRETTVKDITKRAGIAQGLFHYYFKSKDEVLAAVVQMMSQQLIDSINTDTLFAPCRNAVDKINRLMYLIFGYEVNNVRLLDEFRNMTDITLRDSIAFTIVEAAVAIGVPFIREGIAEGLFVCEHPTETAEVFAYGMTMHLKKLFLDENSPPEIFAKAFFMENMEKYRDMAMRLLGMTAAHGLFELPEGWQ